MPYCRRPVKCEEDLRYPVAQAEQGFGALQQRRREGGLARFPGGNHELSRSGTPSHFSTGAAVGAEART